ncbi:MAG: PKD domain-containing protein, partial [Planctomycetes bacterium]|nr:PKD domain-containing protein [Planctomycetota bacterium]
SLGHLHLVYELGGEVYYRNDVPVPVAQFAINPSSGEVPLDVEFIDQSGGVIDQWIWSFGDGESISGLESDPTHVYDTTGTYDITLTVIGPGGQDTLTIPAGVQVIDPQNFMSVSPVKVFQNQQDVFIPIIGTHIDPIQGFQVSLEWDCGAINVQELTVDSTLMSSLEPEFVVSNVFSAECFAVLGVVIDLVDPFDGRTLDPGEDHRIANVLCDIPGSAPIGVAEVRLVNGLSDPPIFNIYTANGVSVLPILSPGTVEIVPLTFPPPTLFLRGDFDHSGTDEITDAIGLLGFLFSGGAAPFCLDAADVNDTGVVDVSDVIYLLTFLFSGGNLPPFPYPNLGLDPTPDPLGDC